MPGLHRVSVGLPLGVLELVRWVCSLSLCAAHVSHSAVEAAERVLTVAPQPQAGYRSAQLKSLKLRTFNNQNLLLRFAQLGKLRALYFLLFTVVPLLISGAVGFPVQLLVPAYVAHTL